MRYFKLILFTFLFTFLCISSAFAGWTLTIPDSSVSMYDYDHETEPGKGIVEQKWSWREATSPTWHTFSTKEAMVNDFNANVKNNTDYLIRLEVKDIEGEWSFPSVMLVTTRPDNLPPVAQFSVSPNPVVVNQTFVVINTSYDPNGDKLTSKWRYQKPDGSWTGVTSSPPTSFPTEGDYTIELVVNDGKVDSEPFYQTVKVIPENRPPVARFTVDTQNPADRLATNPLTFYDYVPLKYDTSNSYDPDGDPIVAYQWYLKKASDSTWTQYTNPPTTFENLGPGNWQIGLAVLDQPVIPQLTPLWSSGTPTKPSEPSYIVNVIVKEGFMVQGYIEPIPAERRRKIRIYGEAVRPSNPNEKVDISSMRAEIPLNKLPSGYTTQTIQMTYDPEKQRYYCDFLIPDKEILKNEYGVTMQNGLFPDDGTYQVRIIGRKDNTEKEAILEFNIKGHIYERTIIRTKSY
ncbi:hypothetical protein [Desulfofalx alkaliphila]|uniref:hypothetical protein n=1 Tax=Desulfofalx alkaliphila TaxID=105483 RepID=UPI0004E23555|nr:hypothetical protein [Desulfofalx alkaliphila]